MKAGKKIAQQLGMAKRALRNLRKQVGGAGKGIAAGLTGAAFILGNTGKSIRNKAVDIKDSTFDNKKRSGEVITLKKSTVVALLMALAAVAGVLAALYFYVLRREKELDEYEQLLFSEDFDDDDPPDDEPDSDGETETAEA